MKNFLKEFGAKAAAVFKTQKPPRLNLLEEKYADLLSEKTELEYQLSELKARNENIIKQDNEIRTLHENVRHIKHDMKNHLMVIASYLNDQDYESAKEYTSQILDKLNASHSYVETGNSLLNHILNEKLNKAREMGISIKAEIENLSFAKMESLDFSALLSNILDNAVESCGKQQVQSENSIKLSAEDRTCYSDTFKVENVPAEAPKIIVIISARRGYETILVKNSITRSVLAENPNLATTKSDMEHHGIGIAQIKNIVKKYGGLCDFYEETDVPANSYEERFFCAGVFIPK